MYGRKPEREPLTGEALSEAMIGDTQTAIADTEPIPQSELPGDAMADPEPEKETPEEK